jgi:hypothetical protein
LPPTEKVYVHVRDEKDNRGVGGSSIYVNASDNATLSKHIATTVTEIEK